MSEIKEHDLVIVDKNTSKERRGTVVHVFPDNSAFIVELFDDGHHSLGTETFPLAKLTKETI